jgi:murein L,D-transpeptidase YcbB/YkuD
LGLNYSGAEKIGVKFTPITFTPINNPLTDDVVQVAAAKAAAKAAEKEAAAKAAATPESENKETWDKVVEYYEGNKDPNWEHESTGEMEINGELYRYIKVMSKDKNDKDFYMNVLDDGRVYIYNKGPRTGRSFGTWEWDGTKPVIKFKNISKNASGYVQSTDTDWSAVTKDNRIIGLYAQGPLVKQIQNKLINYGYSGTTSGSITTDVEGCKADVEKCDGIYGKLTKEMVKQYQKDNGLAVDGIVGQQTYESMF